MACLLVRAYCDVTRRRKAPAAGLEWILWSEIRPESRTARSGPHRTGGTLWRRRLGHLLDGLKHFAEFVEHFVYVVLLDDQRWRQGDNVAGDADQQSLVISLEEGL